MLFGFFKTKKDREKEKAKKVELSETEILNKELEEEWRQQEEERRAQKEAKRLLREQREQQKAEALRQQEERLRQKERNRIREKARKKRKRRERLKWEKEHPIEGAKLRVERAKKGGINDYELDSLSSFVSKVLLHEFHKTYPNSLAPKDFIPDRHDIAVFDVIACFHAEILASYLKEKKYLVPLLRKQAQLVYRDDYGDVHYEEFDKELKRFVLRRNIDEINKFVETALREDVKALMVSWYELQLSRFQLAVNRIAKSIEHSRGLSKQEIKELENHRKALIEHPIARECLYFVRINDAIDDPMNRIFHLSITSLKIGEKNVRQKEEPAVVETKEENPYEFEAKIGRKFKILGWDTQVTKGSGDQGADVVITKGNLRGVVQCKLYSQPVGNEAVQEVHAAKGYYDANFAVVVSNQSFTTSARMLANKLNVYLINEDEIKEFSELMS